MKLSAIVAISAGLFAGPMLAQEKAASTPRQGLEEARTLNHQSLPEAIAFERQKVARAEREARLARTRRNADGEVAADYVGPSARSTGSADRTIEGDPGNASRDQRQDPPKR